MAGTLFVVATPIGNLEDLTFRALRTLKEVDLIAAEDTRRTAKLLAHYEIRTPLQSVREHNELREAPRLIARMTNGASIALVTDAGTPGIADPGARLVAAAREAGVRVIPIPGPSAVTAALSVSGFSADEFVFMGFPPRSGSERRAWLLRLAQEPRVSVFFEAPHRIERTIGDITKYCAGRHISISRELTKIHEMSVVWPIEAAGSGDIPSRGEFVVVVGPGVTASHPVFDVAKASDMLGRLTELAGVERSQALDMVGLWLGVQTSEVKKSIKKYRISVNKQNSASP